MNGHLAPSNGFPVLAKTDRTGAADCPGNNCPTVYGFEGDDILIQGYEADALIASVPAGEKVVRIPKGLIRQLVANGQI